MKATIERRRQTENREIPKFNVIKKNNNNNSTAAAAVVAAIVYLRPNGEEKKIIRWQ